MDVRGLILCGGKGTRLRPLTDTIPKPLVELRGKPCLDYIVRMHIERGQRELILCIGYKGEMIRDFVAAADFDAEIQFSDCGENASMLQRLHGALPLMGERASVSYGDTLIAVDLPRMLESHHNSGAAITLTTAEVVSPFGLLTIGDDGFVSSYREKPAQPYYVGHMVLERSVLEEVSDEVLRLPDGGGLVRVFENLLAERKLAAFPYSGPQVTFNTRQDLDRAERDLSMFFTQAHGEGE